MMAKFRVKSRVWIHHRWFSYSAELIASGVVFRKDPQRCRAPIEQWARRCCSFTTPTGIFMRLGHLISDAIAGSKDLREHPVINLVFRNISPSGLDV